MVLLLQNPLCVRERGSEGERENMHMCWKGGRVHIIVWKEKSGYINSISDFWTDNVKMIKIVSSEIIDLQCPTLHVW